MQVKTKINKIVEKTNGKKTTFAAIAMVLFQIINIWKPDLISPQAENTIEIVISSGLATTLFHKITRNWTEIKSFFTKKNDK